MKSNNPGNIVKDVLGAFAMFFGGMFFCTNQLFGSILFLVGVFITIFMEVEDADK